MAAFNYAFSRKSRNVKTGDIPVTTSDSRTCPNACPLKESGACYAAHGPLGMFWKKVDTAHVTAKGTTSAITWRELLDNVSALPDGQLWRHNQAGDLPGENDSIDSDDMIALIDANKGKRGFTYTHKPMTDINASLVKLANDNGLTVNLSADDLHEADELKSLNIGPVVTIAPIDAPEKFMTPNGHKVIVCPAQSRDDVTCKSCGLCAVASRDVIVAFRAHGVSAKKAQAVFERK